MTAFPLTNAITTTRGSKLILDASNTKPTSLIVSGNAVSSWIDQGSSHYTATQGTGANQPSSGAISHNGLNMLGFNGSNSSMLLSSANAMNTPLTLFVVAKQNSLGSNGYIIARDAGGAPTGTIYLTIVSGTLQTQLRNADNTTRTIDYTTPCSIEVFIACIKVANGYPLYLNMNNGTPVEDSINATGQTTSAGSIGIGYRQSNNTGYLNGAIGEILGFSAYLNSSETNDIFRALSNKWGIAIS